MEIDRQLEKADESSQDNIFPESKANKFTEFGQQDVIKNFHELKSWEEKYKVALSLRDPRAQFIAKRLIFGESPKTLSKEDFKIYIRKHYLLKDIKGQFSRYEDLINDLSKKYSKSISF